MVTIDADAHVVESEHTWDYMDPAERKYRTRQAGTGVLMIGTDYGHQDMSVELDSLRTLGARGDLAPVATQKILDDNPRALYGL